MPLSFDFLVCTVVLIVDWIDSLTFRGAHAVAVVVLL